MRAAPENKAETTSREHELAIRRPPKTSDPASDCNCLTVRGPCAPGLVAGRYQPLADDVTIAGDVRPNLSSAVNQKTKEIGLAFKSDFLRLRRRCNVPLSISSAFGERASIHFNCSAATAAE